MVAYLNDCSFADSRAKSNDSILHGALFKVRAMTDDDIIHLAAYDFGWWQEAG